MVLGFDKTLCKRLIQPTEQNFQLLLPSGVDSHNGDLETFRSVDFLDSKHGWAVGQRGMILATGDGGETWTLQTSGTSEELRSVHFYDSSHGTALEVENILSTDDGGATWKL